MALATSCRQMAAQQLEARLLVARQCERGRPEAVHRVALLALVSPATGSELARMRVFMTIETCCVRDFVECRFARRDVTLGAFHGGMFAQQRIVALLMHAGVEERGSENIFAMALSAIRAAELALVRIGIVTAGAKIIGNWLPEIAALVTIVTGGFDMRTVQRKGRLVVIEADGRGGLQHLPAGGHVATLARSGKRSAVRILMAIGARGEGNFFIRHEDLGIHRSRLMAVCARGLLVQPGQWIDRGTVIEAAGGLPCF